LETNLWKSEYTINAEKHGFTYDSDRILDWKNANTPYGSFEASVRRTADMVASLPLSKKGTIKSAAYMHLPNNLDNGEPANSRFESIFKLGTYAELNTFYGLLGTTTKSAKLSTANRYYNLFIKNNGT